MRITLATVTLTCALAACSQTPTSPLGAADAGMAAMARKPGATSSFDFAFYDAGAGPGGYTIAAIDQFSGVTDPWPPVPVSGGPASMTGTVSGASGSRIFSLSGGLLTVTVRDVIQSNPNCGPEMQAVVESKGLVGTALRGTANLRVDEGESTMDLTLNNVAADGVTWQVRFNSTSGARARITEDGGGIQVIQDYGEVSFREPAPRGNKFAQIYTCRAYYSFSLVSLP